MPTVQALLDDGSGTFPIDVSSRVDMSVGAKISSYGRSNEASSADASTLELTLDNSDGAFTGHGPGFGIGGFGVTPFGGGYDITPDKTRIRLKVTQGATTVDRFTGRIATSDLDLGFGLGVCNIDITAADVLADLSRRIMRSMLEEEVLSDEPSAYYTMGEPAGATAAGDTSGNGAPPLTPSGSGAAVAFGNGVGPVDGLSAATFSGGQFLTDATPGTFLGPIAWTLELWLNVPAPPTATMGVIQAKATDNSAAFALSLDTSGRIAAFGPNLCDGLTHHVAVTWDGGPNQTYYVDGTSIGTTSIGGAMGAMNVLLVGGNTFSPLIYSGTISHIATYTAALPAFKIADHYLYGTDPTEDTAARLARIGDWAGVTTAVTAGMSGQLMPRQSTSGRAALDVLKEIEDAEGGVVFSDGSGRIVLQGRGYRSGKTTPTVTLNADDVATGTRVPWDTQQYTDQITVTRNGGATQVVGNTVSPRYPTTLDLTVDTDAAALNHGRWLLLKSSVNTPRMPTTNLLPRGSSNAEAILNLDIGDRIAFANLPAQMYTNAGDQVFEGRTETITQDEWTITPNLVPWSLFTALALDDPTFGALDAYPISY